MIDDLDITIATIDTLITTATGERLLIFLLAAAELRATRSRHRALLSLFGSGSVRFDKEGNVIQPPEGQ